jgi:hypothetical protein
MLLLFGGSLENLISFTNLQERTGFINDLLFKGICIGSPVLRMLFVKLIVHIKTILIVYVEAMFVLVIDVHLLPYGVAFDSLDWSKLLVRILPSVSLRVNALCLTVQYLIIIYDLPRYELGLAVMN